MLLEGRHEGQCGLRALVLVATSGDQAVAPAAADRVEQGHVGVVGAEEPRRGDLDAAAPPLLPGDPVRPRAGVVERRDLDGLLVEARGALPGAAPADGDDDRPPPRVIEG